MLDGLGGDERGRQWMTDLLLFGEVKYYFFISLFLYFFIYLFIYLFISLFLIPHFQVI